MSKAWASLQLDKPVSLLSWKRLYIYRIYRFFKRDWDFAGCNHPLHISSGKEPQRSFGPPNKISRGGCPLCSLSPLSIPGMEGTEVGTSQMKENAAKGYTEGCCVACAMNASDLGHAEKVCMRIVPFKNPSIHEHRRKCMQTNVEILDNSIKCFFSPAAPLRQARNKLQVEYNSKRF